MSEERVDDGLRDRFQELRAETAQSGGAPEFGVLMARAARCSPAPRGHRGRLDLVSPSRRARGRLGIRGARRHGGGRAAHEPGSQRGRGVRPPGGRLLRRCVGGCVAVTDLGPARGAGHRAGALAAFDRDVGARPRSFDAAGAGDDPWAAGGRMNRLGTTLRVRPDRGPRNRGAGARTAAAPGSRCAGGSALRRALPARAHHAAPASDRAHGRAARRDQPDDRRNSKGAWCAYSGISSTRCSGSPS